MTNYSDEIVKKKKIEAGKPLLDSSLIITFILGSDDTVLFWVFNPNYGTVSIQFYTNLSLYLKNTVLYDAEYKPE